MADKKLLSVGDFAKISQVSLVMLRHYDKLGLLSPTIRGDNHYRYYSFTQLSEIKLIRTMQESGMSLREIKDLKDRRDPTRTAETLRLQIESIEQKINGWRGTHQLFSALLDSIESARGIDEAAITIEYLPAKRLVLGDLNVYAKGEDGYDALVRFYNAIGEKYPDADLNYPVWGTFSKENLKIKTGGARTLPERYFFYVPDGDSERPAGLYAIGYARGGYGQNGELYMRMGDYIDENGFEICGDAYEEYPLNEICVADESLYLMRVMIAVRKRPS